jgi:multiple sugar transport system permease protein
MKTKRNVQYGWSKLIARAGNYFFVAPMLIYMFLTMAYPIYINLQMSVHNVTIQTFRSNNAPFVGADNYIKLLNDAAFLNSVRLSLTFTLVSIILQFTVGFALALFFNKAFPGNSLLRSLLLLAWLLPSVVVGNIFRWMLDGDYGTINYFLLNLGILQETRYWLLDPYTALLGTIFANAWVGIPFNMLLLFAGLQTIPPTLYEAASIDGAGPVERFMYITVPMMRPVAASVLILCFIYTFKVFDLIYVMTAGGPVDVTTVLPILTYKLTFTFFRFSDGAASATALLLGLLFLAVAYTRLIQSEEQA